MKSVHVKTGVLVLLLFLAGIVTISRVNISSDLGFFLPDSETQFERLLRHQLDNGASTNIILVALTGLSAKALAEVNLQFTARLRQSKAFGQILNNASSLSEEVLAYLEKNRYLLTHSNLAGKFSVDGFRQSLRDRQAGLASTLSPLEKRFIRHDPTGEVIGLLSEWQGKISRHKVPNEQHGVWFSEDRTRTLILLEIAADVADMKNQMNAVYEVRGTFEQLKVPGLEVIISGPAVFAVESAEDIRADIRNLTLVAVSIVGLFLLTVYRSMRRTVLIFCPLAMGVLAATAVILLMYGQIHGVTLAFGITLVGVAVDYPIHIMMGIVSGDPDRVRKIWRTLRLGVFSTVVAYSAFLIPGFNGLQQLGLFTIVGLITAALFSRWVLPWLVMGQGEAMLGMPKVHNLFKLLAVRAVKLRIIVIFVLTGSLLALLFVDTAILHLNVDSLSPIGQERRAEGKMLRDDLGFWYGGSMLVISKTDKEAVLRLSEKIEPYLDEFVNQKVINGYDMASSFLPSLSRQQANRDILLNTVRIRENLAAALKDTPFKPQVFAPFLEELDAAGKRDLIDSNTLEQTVIGKKLEPLLFDFDGAAGGTVLLHGVTDDKALTRFVQNHEGLYYMHLKTASTDLVVRSVKRVAVAMLGSVVCIYLVLAIAFKSLTRPFKVMIPTFAAAAGVAGILVFSGNPLSIFHLISLLLVVGLGLDYALFFNRLTDSSEEWDTTFKSIWVCGATTILVFGILIFSNTPPLQAIGATVGLGTFMNLVFAAMWAATPMKLAIDMKE